MSDETTDFNGRVWIAWQHSRRSQTLARELQADMYVLCIENNEILRHSASFFWTLITLLRVRPTVIFIQLSYFLHLAVVLYKLLSRPSAVVVADCHTKALRRQPDNLLKGLYNGIRRLCFRHTDVAIIATPRLAADISSFTSKYHVLADKIPEFATANTAGNYCVYISSFAADEPFHEVAEAAKKCPLPIMCTGKIPPHLKNHRFDNLHLTDYLPDRDYIDLLHGASCIVALTTENGCLQCGAYEGLAIGAPLVISDTVALRDYFEEAAVYVKNTSDAILEGIRTAIRERDRLTSSMEALRTRRDSEFNESLAHLCQCVQHREVADERYRSVCP